MHLQLVELQNETCKKQNLAEGRKVSSTRTGRSPSLRVHELEESDEKLEEKGDDQTNSNAPAARRRRTGNRQAAPPNQETANLPPVADSPASTLRPDYKWSSAPARPAVLRPALLAAARCHSREFSPIAFGADRDTALSALPRQALLLGVDSLL